jgi:tryptophan synthase beta chain
MRSSCSAAPKASSPRWNPATPLPRWQEAGPTMGKDQIILANLCGRGDKDIFSVAEHLGVTL